VSVKGVEEGVCGGEGVAWDVVHKTRSEEWRGDSQDGIEGGSVLLSGADDLLLLSCSIYSEGMEASKDK
jgi:hypothetical protein